MVSVNSSESLSAVSLGVLDKLAFSAFKLAEGYDLGLWR